MIKPDCYTCKYRGMVAGDAHSCCEYPGNDTGILSFFSPVNKTNAIKLGIKGNPQGIRGGWFMWPVNFDPRWLVECNGHLEKIKKNRQRGK